MVLHRHGQRVPSLLFMLDRTVWVPEPGLVLPFLLSVLRRYARRGGPLHQFGSARSPGKDKHPGGVFSPEEG